MLERLSFQLKFGIHSRSFGGGVGREFILYSCQILEKWFQQECMIIPCCYLQEILEGVAALSLQAPHTLIGGEMQVELPALV